MSKLSSLEDFARGIIEIWVSERPNQFAAALAYFGMISFSAVIYMAYLVAGIFINEAAAAERMYTRIEAILGPETATFIRDSVSAITASEAGGSWIISAVSLISLLMVAMGFAASAFDRRFRGYTIITLIGMLAFGAWSGMDAPRIEAGLATPWVGVKERIFWYAYQLWFMVLAFVLLRERKMSL